MGRDLDYLRAVVRWADSEREDYWYPDGSDSLSPDAIMAIYDAIHSEGYDSIDAFLDEQPGPKSLRLRGLHAFVRSILGRTT